MKSSMVICDSNIWIAFFNKDDSTHQEAIKILSELEQNQYQVAVTDMIIAEVCSVLKNKKAHNQAAGFIDFIQTHNIEIIYSIEYFDFALELFKTSGKDKLSFVDISLLVLAQKGYEIKTLDKALRRRLKSVNLKYD